MLRAIVGRHAGAPASGSGSGSGSGSVLVSAAVACSAVGEESYADAAFAPHCGAAAPLRLLALTGGEVLLEGGLTRVGDRYYLRDADHPPNGHGAFDTARTFSVGLCGEDPRIVAAGSLGTVRAFAAWPDQALACTGESWYVGTADLVALDPLGERAPEVLIERACAAAKHDSVAGGLVVTYFNDESPSRAVLAYFPYAVADTPAFLPRVELGYVRVTFGMGDLWGVVALEDELLYIDAPVDRGGVVRLGPRARERPLITDKLGGPRRRSTRIVFEGSLEEHPVPLGPGLHLVE